MKRILVSAAVVAEEVQIGFNICPVKLNPQGKDPHVVGLGSYIPHFYR
jgi:hypothetical protein